MNKIKEMPLDLFSTLQEAKNWVEENRTVGCICPCCNRLVKVYKRKLNSGMAQELIALYSLSLCDDESEIVFYHHTKFAKLSGGEISKLKHWGLVVEKENDLDEKVLSGDKKTSGFWGITQKGRKFVENKIKVEKYIFLLDAVLIDTSEDETTNIIDALGDKFNYYEMMGITSK